MMSRGDGQINPSQGQSTSESEEKQEPELEPSSLPQEHNTNQKALSRAKSHNERAVHVRADANKRFTEGFDSI